MADNTVELVKASKESLRNQGEVKKTKSRFFLLFKYNAY